MNNSDEQRFTKIDKNLEDLNKKVSFLQDLILNMKLNIEIMAKSKAEEHFLPELTVIADDNLELFLEKRPLNCHLLEKCSTSIEKGTVEILRTFTEKGANSAIELINSYNDYAMTNPEVKTCPDIECLKNATQVFVTLVKLIKSTKKKATKQTKDLYSISRESSVVEGSEEECNLLTPLSNKMRLKILKTLSNGSHFYNQLERQVGIKGGRFHFHLKKLIDASYVYQEQDKGPYKITMSGLKALKFLVDLKEELSMIV